MTVTSAVLGVGFHTHGQPHTRSDGHIVSSIIVRLDCIIAEYACDAWYRIVNAKMKNKLQTAQDKMIRYLLNYGCRRHIDFNDFKKSNFLDNNARVDFEFEVQ